VGVRVGAANFFFDQSVDIDETNTYQLQCFSSMKIVGAVGVTDLGGLWALKWSACYIHSDGSSIPFTLQVTGIKASNNSRKF